MPPRCRDAETPATGIVLKFENNFLNSIAQYTYDNTTYNRSKQASIQQTKTSSMMNSEVSQDKENQSPNLLMVVLAFDGCFEIAESRAAGSSESAIDLVSCFY